MYNFTTTKSVAYPNHFHKSINRYLINYGQFAEFMDNLEILSYWLSTNKPTSQALFVSCL
jgi:hypothetical protein